MPFLSARTFSLIFCFDLRLRFSLALSPLINDICAPQWSFVQGLQSLFLVTLAITAPSISYQPKEGAIGHRENFVRIDCGLAAALLYQGCSIGKAASLTAERTIL
ncbi:MAG TPA: hypothetical protein VK699_12860 [Terriglobales bacterium]|jgi:hypothetical protein|nr:hypothetical protein [Terriglobales bacterium]